MGYSEWNGNTWNGVLVWNMGILGMGYSYGIWEYLEWGTQYGVGILGMGYSVWSENTWNGVLSMEWEYLEVCLDWNGELEMQSGFSTPIPIT